MMYSSFAILLAVICATTAPAASAAETVTRVGSDDNGHQLYSLHGSSSNAGDDDKEKKNSVRNTVSCTDDFALQEGVPMYMYVHSSKQENLYCGRNEGTVICDTAERSSGTTDYLWRLSCLEKCRAFQLCDAEGRICVLTQLIDDETSEEEFLAGVKGHLGVGYEEGEGDFAKIQFHQQSVGRGEGKYRLKVEHGGLDVTYGDTWDFWVGQSRESYPPTLSGISYKFADGPRSHLRDVFFQYKDCFSSGIDDYELETETSYPNA